MVKDCGRLAWLEADTRAQGWPDALLEAAPTECPCAVAVQEQIRDFFNATAQPAQPPVAALQPGRDRPGGC